MPPLVTIIVPITKSRMAFMPALKEMIRKQTYPNIETIYLTSETDNIGTKRNKGCSLALGDIIVHMDSDDRYSPQWVEKSVEALVSSSASITGLNKAYFFSQEQDLCYHYTYLPTDNADNFMLGATLCYWKSYWQSHKFREQQIGEDFYFTTECGNIFVHDYKEGFASLIHAGNSSVRDVTSANYRPCRKPELLKG